MEGTIEFIKVISSLLWPICFLLIVFMFRKEIRTLINSINKKPEKVLEAEFVQPVQKETALTPVDHSPGQDGKVIKADDEVIPVCRHLRTEKNFIFLRENNSTYECITPLCEIKSLDKNQFSECEDISSSLIEEKQREKIYWWIQSTESSVTISRKDQQRSGYLPSYMRMLKNPRTEPSRMLRYIKGNEKVSWYETKQYLHDTYGYELTSGSVGASLKALEELGLVNISGQGENKKITFTVRTSGYLIKNRKPVEIISRDFWIKIVEMLQHHWALIDDDPDSGSCTVFFIHDLSGVFDRLRFASKQDAFRALRRNGFGRFTEDNESQKFIAPPHPPFYEDQHENGPIYSSGRFWH